MEPEAVQIIIFNGDGTIMLNKKALYHILMKDEIRDRHVSVISVTGVFRQGKSFLLNFFIRYLQVKYVEKRNVKDWLKPEDGPLAGFRWAPGSKRHTTGIHMWSEIFLTKLPTGEEVAIILLDTQGAFDNQTSLSDCVTIFTLSTLISSVQIYNVMRNIKQYDLTHLQLFGGYGKLISTAGTAPFQNLCFLVRDWACPYEKPYGAIGGAVLLGEVFDEAEVSELKRQTENVRDLFDKVNCFLLPYPGRVVDASAEFNGDLKDIDECFKQHIQEFVEMILAPQNLILKTIHGGKIKAGDLIHYIEEYSSVLKEGKMPKVETIFKATVEAHHKAAALSSLKLYKKIMDCDCKLNPKCYSSSEIYHKHSITKLKAVDHYGKTKKFEDSEINDKYLLELKNSMDEEFQEYRKINEQKVREMEERRKRMQEQLRLASRDSGEGSSLGTLNIAERAGTAVAVVGGIAMLVFGASKLFSSSRGNNE
ncbi:atlastin-like [Asbolus verrucosus]|uniref:Atlastin-like n=1 Tax=Asbolus verrucosus TaxID=1661398 RepID=A0A482V836_ASBVE|nr:atlastin-like [Asbolus verrucosus]